MCKRDQKLVRVKGVVGKVHSCIAFTPKEELKQCLPPCEAEPKDGLGYLETNDGPIAVEWSDSLKQWVLASEKRVQEGPTFNK